MVYQQLGHTTLLCRSLNIHTPNGLSTAGPQLTAVFTNLHTPAAPQMTLQIPTSDSVP